MDYFTFLGIGNINTGYIETIYDTENDSVLSKFVQEAVFKTHQSDIERIVVFCTVESKSRYEEEFIELFKEKYSFENICFIEMEKNISSEDFISLLVENISAKEMIIDVTHCYRNIPMKLLLTLRYIEKSCNTKIRHLYYGRLKEDTTAVLEDSISDYELQGLSSALELFDKTLFLSSETISISNKKDNLISGIISKMDALNQNFETCNLDNSVKCCKGVYDACKAIEKKPDEYKSIIPLLRNIMNKFEKLHSLSNETEQDIEMIRVLVNHQKMQSAITFTDQTFRKQLVKLSIQNPKLILNNDDDLYDASQYLISNGAYAIYNNYAEEKTKSKDILDKYSFNINPQAKNILNNNKVVFNFLHNIRNKVNHGQRVEQKQALSSVSKMVELIIDLNKILRG